MPRVFLALSLPDPARDALTMRYGGIEDARWIAPDDLHVTLRFIGEIDGGDGRALDAALAAVRAAPVEIEMTGFSAFGSKAQPHPRSPSVFKPRSVHAVVAKTDALVALQRRIDRAVEAAELEPERRRFSPHVTMARFSRTGAADAGPWLARQAPLEPGARRFTASAFGLYSAKPSVGGGPYVLEAEYPLTG